MNLIFHFVIVANTKQSHVCFLLSVLHLQALHSTMANLNTLPDLSTVDIQAIQDSGPVHPRISLPPLTTIAENWDSVEPSSRNLNVNDESFSEDDESEEEEQSHSSTPGKVQDRNSHRTSCSSSSSAPDSGTDSSESELSNATSDSAGSSSSSSDSDSDSQSSASSASSKSKKKIQQAPVHRGKTSFSVREANFDKGRVTLRLSTLQLGKKEEIIDNPFGKIGKISKHENARTTNICCVKSCDSDSLCGNSNNQLLCSKLATTKSRANQVNILFVFASRNFES